MTVCSTSTTQPCKQDHHVPTATSHALSSGSSLDSVNSIASQAPNIKPLSKSNSRNITTCSDKTDRAPWLRQLYLCWVVLFFMGSSLGAIFINKTCLTGYHFRYPLTMMLLQMGSAIACLSILHIAGYINLPHASFGDLVVLSGPTVLFTSNIVVGLSALSLVNIPMFSAFRRITLLFVMVAEYIYLKKTHSRQIVCTVTVMTVGAFVSAIDDVSFSRLGYCLVFANNGLTAAYLASIKNVMKVVQISPLALLYYTALLGFPLVTTMVISTGELAHVLLAFRTQPELLSWGFMVSLLLTAMGAFAVNFSTSLCTDVTSPLTTSVAGQVKNVLQTILGFFSWGFVPTVMNTVGLLIALCAQMFFAYLKYQEQDMTMWKPVPTEETKINSKDNSASDIKEQQYDWETDKAVGSVSEKDTQVSVIVDHGRDGTSEAAAVLSK